MSALISLLLKAGLQAFFGFLTDQFNQMQRDAANRQEGRRQEADDQAKAGAIVDATVGDVASHPPSIEDVFRRLDGGTA